MRYIVYNILHHFLLFFSSHNCIHLIQVSMQAQIRQQGTHETLHRDMIVGFGTWEFDPMELENLFPNNEGSVHLWQGDDDVLVPVTLQRYIAQKLPWIHYHEIPGAGHLFPFAPGMVNNIVKTLLTNDGVEN